jgi:N-acetylglucosamine-6-phosphate deacetylase
MLEELIGAARGTLRQMTIAPEMPNAFEAIGVLVEAGVIVSIGHTLADYEQTKRAFDLGARILTHAFNAMVGIHHRKPGPVVAAFEDERVTIELILDGLHVYPEVARMVFAAAPGRVAVITDAIAAAGSNDGYYRLGGMNVTVTEGRAVLSGTPTMAGSTLTQDAALRVAITSARLDPRVAVEALTATPARTLGLDHELGRIRPGFAADAVLLDHDWHVQNVWANGLKLIG